MASVAEVLYRLQAVDFGLSEQGSKLREAEGLLGESRELRDARRQLAKATEKLEACVRRIRELEMDLKKVNERLDSTADKLYGGSITNPKELAGLQKDLEHSKGQRSSLEDEVLTAMVCIEEYEQAVADSSARLDGALTKWQEAQSELRERITALGTAIAELQERREQLASSVGGADLQLFEDLKRSKGGRAVAALQAGMCEGCRVAVPSGRVQLVGKGTELVMCGNCGRMLCLGA